MKQFDQWNSLKKQISLSNRKVFFKEREIWFGSLGVNIGYEQDGKHTSFERPILIFKKFNHDTFWGIPLTSTQKKGIYHFPLFYRNQNSTLILSQLRLLDAKRLRRKVRMISKQEFENVSSCVYGLIKNDPLKYQ